MQITQRMDRELASRHVAASAGAHSSPSHEDSDGAEDEGCSMDDTDLRTIGRSARRQALDPQGPLTVAAGNASSISTTQAHSGHALASQAAYQTSAAAVAGGTVSPIITPEDFKLAVPPELDAYDPESGISYVQHAENVLAARSARRATAVRSVFDKVLTSLGGARSLQPKQVHRIARELGLPQEQLAAMVGPKHIPGRRFVEDPPRGAPDRAGSVVTRILTMMESTEGLQPAAPVDAATLARRTQRAERREESRRTRQQLQRAEHEVLMNSAFSPSPIQLSLSEQGGGKEQEGGGSPPSMDTRLGSGGDAILDMLVPPEDTWHRAAQLHRESAPSAAATASASADGKHDSAADNESSELAQVLAMLEQEASSGGQGTSDAYQQLASFSSPAPRHAESQATQGESKVVVQPPPVHQKLALSDEVTSSRHAPFAGDENAAEDDDDNFSIGSTKWEDDDGVVDTRAYFEAGIGSGAAAASSTANARAIQSYARAVGAGLSDSPELDGTGMTDDHREAVAASMALLANEPGMEFLRGGMGGGGYGGMGFPGM